MQDLIARPQFLWLFALGPLVWYFWRHSLARMTPRQRIACLAVRLLLLALLTLALAGLRIPWQSRDVAVVFAVDRSASITTEAEAGGRAFIEQALAARGRGDEAVLLGFARGVRSLPLPDKEKGWPALKEANDTNDANDSEGSKNTDGAADRNATAVAKALSFSSATFPDGKIRRLVLLSDGYDTEGHTAEAAAALKEAGIEFFTVPLRNPARPEVLVEKFTLPGELREGEPFDATATIRSNIETGCKVRLYADGFVAGEQTANLRPGSNTIVFRNLRPGQNQAAYEIELLPEKDTLPDNNKAQASALQKGKPRLLVIDSSEDRLQPLKSALVAEKIEVETRPAQGLPKRIEELQGYDALVLSDISALHLSRAQMQLYARWVKDFGGGFAMLGGENSFGVGGYFRTPIEAMLPVKTDHDDRAETPSVALMIVLDNSGSMNAQVAGQTKMSLANQGAALALDVLQPKDLLGVMAVDTKVHMIAPLARHANKGEVSRNILRITAGGGGIYVYTSLVEAYAQLREVNAKIKHIILFSDAADAEEKASGEMPDGAQVPGTAVDLAAAMTSARITTSVVALGSGNDKDVSFLKQLALTGGGRFYLTSDALTLPQIFTTETMRVAQSSLSEDPFSAVPVRKAEVLEGIAWDQAPLLLGYNVTKLKPTADLLLATEGGDPLLATWRYGLGQVAAFTSDAKSRWASEWLGWPGYGKFWAQLARSLMRRSGQAHGLHVETFAEPGGIRVEIDAVGADGMFRNELPLTVASLRADESTAAVEARQTAPGRYSAFVATSGTGTTWINIHSPDLPEGGPAFAHTPSYPAEFLNNGTDEAALRKLAEQGGGIFEPQPESLYAPPAKGIRRHTPLDPFFLAAALLFLPVDIWLRRRSWAGAAA